MESLNKKLEEKKIGGFTFSNNESLENYLSIFYASFLINSHLFIIGPPRVGKTSSSNFFSELLKNNENNYIFFPFHRNTISEFKAQTMERYKGPLIESALKG